MLTVACVFVRANVRFCPDYVTKLRSMVRRHLPLAHRFVCLTDRPEAFAGDPEIQTIRVPQVPMGRAGWWSKLHLFDPENGLRGPGLYLDLDVLVVRSLLPIAEFMPEPLALIPHAGTFDGHGRRLVVKRYNSSVMRIAFGMAPALYRDWTSDVEQRLWGDQDWIGERMPDLPTMPLEWFPRISEIRDPPNWPEEARVVLVKKPKNHDIKAPWIAEHWR